MAIPTCFPPSGENFGSKIVFSSRDVSFQDRLMKASGETKEYVPAYSVSHPAYKQGKIRPEHALHVLNGQWSPMSIREQTVPRISRDDLVRMSVSPNRFLFVPPYSSERVDLDGYPRVLNGKFHLSKEEFAELEARRWPMDVPGTIVPAEHLNGETDQ